VVDRKRGTQARLPASWTAAARDESAPFDEALARLLLVQHLDPTDIAYMLLNDALQADQQD
jgi:hypothetical protein